MSAVGFENSLEGGEFGEGFGDEENSSEDESGSESSDGETDEDDSESEEETTQNEEEAVHDVSDDDVEREACPICLNRFIGQDLGTPESCDHTFCLECIEEWSKNINTCPIDRTEFHHIIMRSTPGGEEIRKIKVKVRPKEPEESIQESVTLCEVCHHGDREDRLLLCDACDLAYHCECLDPPLFHIPIEEWFCPHCSEIMDNGAVAGPSHSRVRRVIPRTRASETVRSRVQTLRTSGSAVKHRSPSATKSKPPVTRKPRKRKRASYRPVKKVVKLARTQKNVLDAGKGKVAATGATITLVTYRKRRRRKRKRARRKLKVSRKSLSSSKALPIPSVKKRIADRLGICKPPAGLSIPRVKQSSGSRQSARSDRQPSCFLFGERDQLMNFSENFNEDVKPTNTAGPSTSRQEEPGSSAAPVNILDSIMAGQTLLHSKSDNIIIKTDGSLILKKDQAKDKANSWKLKSDENVTSRTPMSKALIKNGVMSDSKCSKSKNKSSFTNSESNSKSSSSIPHKSVSRLKKESQTKTNSSLKIKSSDSLYHKTKNSQDATKSSTLCGGDKSPKKDISRTSKMMNKKIKSENNSNNFSSSFFPSETSHSNVSDSLSVSSYSPKHEVNENLFKNKCVSNKIYTKRNTSTNDIKASISENSSVQYASDINCNSFATSIETELVNNENVTTPVKKEILSDDETNMDVWDCDSQFSNNSSGASDKIPSNQPIKTQIGSDDETDNESGPNYSEKPNNDDDKLKLLNRSITNVSDENGNENIISQKCSLNFSDDSEFEASLSLLEIPEVSQNSLSSIIKESISALHQNNKSCASSIEREHKVIKKEPLSSDDETDRSSGNDVFRNPNCVSRKMYQNEKIIKEKLLPSKDRNLRNVHKFTYDFEKSSLEHTISNFENSPDYVGNIYDINVECPPTQPVDKCISDVPRPLQDLSIKSHFKNQEFPATLIVENTEIASHVPSINVNSHCDSYIPKKGLYKSFFAKNGILPSTLQFPDCGLSPAQSVVQAVNEEHNPEYSEPPIMSDDNQDTELPATQVFPSIKELPATQLEESVIDNNKFKSDKLKNGSCIKSLDKKNDDKAPKLTVRENILAKIVNDKKLPQIGKLSANKLLRSTRNFINKEYQNPIQNNFSSNKDMLSTNLNSKTGGSDNQPCDENEMPATQLFNSDLLPNTQMIASSDDESNQNNKNKSQQRGAVSNSKCDARIEFLNDFDDIGEADLPETQILPFTQHFKVDKRSLINESNTNSNSIHFSSEESNNLDCTQIFSNQDGCEIDNNTGINSAVNVADMGITIDSECMLPAKQNGNDLLLNISKPALILSKHHLTNSFVPNTSESIETAVEPNHKSSEECESLSGQASNNNELQEQNSKFDKSDIENPPHKTGSGTEDEELTRDKINELLALSKKKKQPLAKVGVHKHLPQVILSVPAKTNIVPKPRKKNTFSFDQVVKKQQCVLDQSSLQSQQSKNLVFEGKELNDGINQRSINSVNTSQREDIFLKRSDVESNNKGSNNDKRLGFLFPEHKNHMNELLSSFSDENQELPATQRIGHSDAAEDSIAEMQSLNKKVVSNQIENPDENMNKVKRNSNKEQLSSGNCAISDEKNNATNEASLLKNSPVSKVIEHKESLKQCTKNKMLDKNVKPFAKDTFQSGDKYYSKASSQDKHKTKQLVESKETTVKKSQNNETNTKGPKSATKTSTNILKRDLNVLESPNTLQENSTKYENKKSSSQNENKKLFLPGKKTKVSTQSNNTQNDLSNDRTQPLSSDAFQKQKNLKDTSSFVADMKKEDLADDEIFPSTQNINSVLSSETSKKSNQSIHSELNYLQHGNSNTSVIDNGSKIDTSQRDDVVSQVKQNVTCVFNTHIKQEIVDDDYLPPTQAINISENIIQTSAEDASVKTTYVGSGFLIENAEDMNDLNKAFKPPNSTILQIKKEVLDEDCTVLSSVINCNVSIKREVLDDDIECIGVHQTSSNSNEATLKTTGADGCALTSNIPLPQFQLNMNIKKEVFSDDEDVIVSDDGEVECIGVLIKPKKKKRSFSKNLGEGGLIPGSDGCLSLAQVDLNIKKEPPSDKEKKCTEASNKSETPLKHSEIDVNIKKRDHLCNDKKECTEKNDQNRLALKYFEENGNASTDDGALSESVRKRKSVGTSPGTYVSKKGKVESSSSKQKEANNNKVSEKCIKKSENCVKYYSKESEKKHKHIQKNIQSNKRKFTEISSTLNCDANSSSKTRNDCESDVSYVKDKSKNISSNERIRTSFDSDRGKRQCVEDVAQVEEVNRHTVTADNHKNTNTYLHKSKEVQKANIVQKSTNIHQENNSINGINHISDHKDRGFNKENPVQKSYNTKYNSHSATSKNHSKDPKECYSKDLKGEIIAEVKGVIEPFYSGGLITKEDYKDIMRKAEPKVDKKQVLKEQIAAEVKSVLKPFYSGGLISKEDYKDIMRRAVPKVFMNCGKIINPEKIKKLVLNYVSLLRNS